MIDIEFYQKYGIASSGLLSESNIKQLQDNTDYMMQNLYATTYELKMGTESYRDKCRINFSEEEYDCVFTYKKMKEPTVNANSIQLEIAPNTVKSGDYITARFGHREDMEDRVYIVSTTNQLRRGHDVVILSLCNHKFNILDENGNIIPIYASVSDTKLMLKESSIGSIENLGVSSIWLTVQANKYTRMLGSQIKRLLIDKFPKDVIDKSTLMATTNIYTIAVKNGHPDEKDDLINGVAYYENYNVEIPPTPPTQFEIVGDDEMWMDLETTYTIDNQTSYDTIWTCDNSKVKIMSCDKTSCTLLCDYDKNMNYKNIVLTAKINVVDYTKTIIVKG